ncbi:MAG: autotransporter strand-loop-strand O-heptosyltransferase [Acidocella sp.]|nr:autotransporter strand-loop-strand O-heptosyltransferase [Acidocella sp.]
MTDPVDAPETGPDAAAKTGPYPPPAALPTQMGPEGIRYDFNLGARVVLPNRTTGTWRVTLRDLDTGNILFMNENKGAFVSSSKHFYVRFGIEISESDADGTRELLRHALDLRDRDVLVLFPNGTLGDSLGWLPYAVRFGETRGCRLICAIAEPLIALVADAYPAIRFMSHAALVSEGLTETIYATYRLGLFFDDKDCIEQPTDFRLVGLHRTAGYILGVEAREAPVHLPPTPAERPIAAPYVCIATQSSSQAKCWNNPYGWAELVRFLKSEGYRVVCIDQKPVHGAGIVWNHIPYGAEDQTGDRPLLERVHWLRHAAFFVGLSSGLSWLAWAAGADVVLISGFTHPTNEFQTPYRVHNWHACNSCWNDPHERFDHHDFLWCPRHAGTARQFECTRLITAEQVIGTVKRVIEARRALKPAKRKARNGGRDRD